MVCHLAGHLAHDAKQEVEFPVTYGGKAALLRIEVFMEDIDSPDVYFFSPPALAAQIDAEMESFSRSWGFDIAGTYQVQMGAHVAPTLACIRHTCVR